MKYDKRCGFTLIELLIAVAIVGILATLTYPTYMDAMRKTRRAEGRSALMQLMQQQERYYSQNNTYIAFSSASTDANERTFKWFSGDNAMNSSYEIRAAACDGEVIQNCVGLTAIPGTGKVNASYTDPVCGNLIMTSTGAKSATGSNCW